MWCMFPSLQRIHVITTTLQSKLEASFQSGLRSRDREVVTRCLQTYASISRCQAAESLFQLLVVQPYMEEVQWEGTLVWKPGL